MNCKTFKSRAIHNLPVCLHFTVFKPSNRGWNLTAGIWFYSAIRTLVRSTCGQQTCSQPAFSSQRSRLGWRSRLCAGRSVLATLNLDKHFITDLNLYTGTSSHREFPKWKALFLCEKYHYRMSLNER